MSLWEETPPQDRQNSLEGLHTFSGLGTPWFSPRRSWRPTDQLWKGAEGGGGGLALVQKPVIYWFIGVTAGSSVSFGRWVNDIIVFKELCLGRPHKNVNPFLKNTVKGLLKLCVDKRLKQKQKRDVFIRTHCGRTWGAPDLKVLVLGSPCGATTPR